MTEQQAEQRTKPNFQLPVKRVDGDSLEENMTENAYNQILPARYLVRDEDRNVKETPEELYERVAKNVAQPDGEYMDFEKAWKQYYDLMTNLKFMPNSPTLMNAGTEIQQLSACFVINPEDSMESIFNKSKEAALIHKSGGGTGYAFHQLRPKGDKVGSTGGISSGPMSFMDVFDATCGTVKQGGKRRGAQMGIMRVDHPDVLRFITSKRTEDNLTNFNISVGVTHDFVEAVKNDETYKLINPRTGEPFKVSKQTQQFYNTDEEYYPTASGSDQGQDDNFWRDFADEFPELNDYDIELEVGEDMELPAKFIWQTLVDSAWVKGEPGIFYYDETNDKHSFDVEKHPEKKIEATNPCGEQPLMNYEACNLGHINLSLLATEQEDGGAYQFAEFKADNPEYDYSDEEQLREAVQEYLQEAMEMDEFERIATLGTRFLDNVVTQSDFPLQEIEDTVATHRKIGLGLMGFAQLMIQFGVRYGSDESVAMAEEIQRLITQFSIEASHELAKERGTFEEWEKSKWANPTEHPEWFEQYTGGLDAENFEDGLELRNHNTTTIAPTGTTSMLGDTSGGCEPIFSMAYFKNVGKDIQGDDMLVEFDDYFIRFLEANGEDVEEVKEEAERLMRNNEWEDVSSLGVVPEEAESLFVSADQVSPEEHVDIQAGFQKYNHSGISKTINFGNDATRQDVEEGYLRALDKGIKGITVYRDGSRDTQVKTTRADNKIDEMDTEELVDQIKEGYDSFEDFLQDDEVPIDYKQQVKEEVGKPEFKKKERPQMLAGTTQEVSTGYGDMYVTINKDGDEAFELFANIGKSGGYTESFTEALGRLSSLALRHGIPITEVADQLRGIRSPRMAWDDGQQVHSIPDGIAKAIARQSDTKTGVETAVTQEGVEVGDDKPDSRDTNGGNKEVEDIVAEGENPECEDCGSMLQMKEGCLTCSNPECGYSKCS